jgi:hypothetical protein
MQRAKPGESTLQEASGARLEAGAFMFPFFSNTKQFAAQLLLEAEIPVRKI